jgi:hypothetical protein
VVRRLLTEPRSLFTSGFNGITLTLCKPTFDLLNLLR